LSKRHKKLANHKPKVSTTIKKVNGDVIGTGTNGVGNIIGKKITVGRQVINISNARSKSSKSGNLQLVHSNIIKHFWGDAKEIRFQLFNNGEATVIMKMMKLVVLNCGERTNLLMTLPGAQLQVYEYDVYLNPEKKEYEIISSSYTKEKPLFIYKQGDADSFIIQINSQQAYWYDFEIIVEWYDITNSQQINISRSPKLRVEFNNDPDQLRFKI
jgi:hypothetical protein